MIFVTGGSGLVGAHLISALISKGNTVKAIYRNTIPQFAGSDKVQWIEGDILDEILLEDILQGVAQVYHCAGMVSFNPKQKKQLFKVNVEGTANVVNACINAGVSKLLFVSSVAALGRIREKGMVNETMQWSEATSNSTYGESKYLAEMEVWRGIAEGLDAVIVNPVIILGGSDWNKSSTGIFKSVYDEFPWYTEGISGFVDVHDVVGAMLLLMNSNVSAQRYILSADNMGYKILFDKIADCFKKERPHKQVTPFLAAVVWRLEAIKGFFSGKSPLLTKETAATAQAKVYFDNSKLLKQFPEFTYSSIDESVARICRELTIKYKL